MTVIEKRGFSMNKQDRRLKTLAGGKALEGT
jgi:hypothetical protein